MAFTEYNNQTITAMQGKPIETSNDRNDMNNEIRKKKELNNGKLS
jgi:hypothetical protein